MQEHITSDTLASEIQMEMVKHRGSFLLLEGLDDRKLFEKFVDTEYCHIVVATSKNNAIGAVKVLEQRKVYKVIAVVDADFDRFFGLMVNHDHIFYTDENDIELMMLCSEAGRDFFREKAQENKRKLMTSYGFKSELDLIIDRAKYMGAARVAIDKNNWMITLKNIGKSFINKKEFTIDKRILAHSIYKSNCIRCQTVGITEQIIHGEMDLILTGCKHGVEICRGHDITLLTGIALQSVLSSLGAERTTQSEIESGLRLAYSWDHFKRTTLYANIISWQGKNIRILREAS